MKSFVIMLPYNPLMICNNRESAKKVIFLVAGPVLQYIPYFYQKDGMAIFI